MRPSPNLVVIGDIDEDILDRRIDIAFGANAKVKDWMNRSMTVEQFMEKHCQFREGKKDGEAIIQGRLGAGGGQRLAQYLVTNDLLILDLDSGASLAHVEARVKELGLFAVIWSTYSHNRPTTSVTEREITKWATQKKITLGFENAELVKHVVDYLTTDKSKEAWLFQDVEGGLSLTREMTDKGVTYILKHQPCPRFRVLFVLDKSYDFMMGNKAERDREWKRAYAAFADNFLPGWDHSCADPARLMYLPKVESYERDLPHTKLTVIAGRMVDITRDAAPVVEDNPFIEFADSAGPGEKAPSSGVLPTFKPQTPTLMDFVRQYKDLDVIRLMQDYGPEDVRGFNNTDQKLEFCCPFEEHHTNQDPTQTAFFMTYEPGSHWHMHCQTDGCKQRAQGDRLVFLDALIQKYQIPPTVLVGYSMDAQAARNATEAAQIAEEEVKRKELWPQLDALTPGSPLADIRTCIEIVSRQSSAIERDEMMKVIASKTGKSERVLNIELKNVEREKRAVAASDTRAEWPGDPKKVVEVWEHWGWDQIVAGASARFCSQNWKAPEVFVRPGVVGQCFIKEDEGGIAIYPMGAANWEAHLTAKLVFKGVVDGDVRSVAPFPNLRMTISGSAKLDLPVLNAVTNVAVFSPDGTLPTQGGYNRDTQTYFRPNYEARPLADVVTPDDVDEAYYWLSEAVRDFPFTDVFGGRDPLPIKTDEVDEEGFRMPNWKRGESSRANFYALILQSFARNFINGPTPAYHFDKAAPGTGAGYLANVAFTIITGYPATAQTLSPNPEELSKALTATLREAEPILFFDNINHPVDSADMAAALTTGTWKARILGQSEVTKVAVRSTWIFTGNNVTFSHELVRRLIPVRMDAAVPNPAAKRGADDFKHFPLQDWLFANRENLIWACQVLVRNWVQKGRPNGARVINSFDSWSKVLGGILQAAGIPGFLDNLDDYRTDLDTEQGTDDGIILTLCEKFGEQEWNPSDAMDAIKDPTTDRIPPEWGIYGNTEHGQLTSLGRILRKLVGKTFEVPVHELKFMPKVQWQPAKVGANMVYRLALTRHRSKNGTLYKLEQTPG